jgi:hypothetical protein
VVHFNPYVDSISGLNFSENQQFLLIVELFSFLWPINTLLVEIGWWSLTFVFGLQDFAGLLYY